MSAPTAPRRPRLGGVFCPVITPLDDRGRLDEPALRRQVDRVVAAGDQVMVLGTSGELPILPAVVADRVVEVAADQLAGRTTLVCGVGDVGTERALANVARAGGAGADAVAVTTPYYYPVDADAVRRHYREVADRSEVPVALYNIPVNTHTPLTREVVADLAQHPNVVAIKDSSGDRDFFAWLLEHRDAHGLAVLQGSDEKRAHHYWRAGIDGYVSGLENVLPGTMLELAAAVRAGDDGAVAAAQARVDAIADLTAEGFWLSVLKAGAALQGVGSGRVSAPLPGLSDELHGRLRETLAAHDLLPGLAGAPG
ncbi:dihydrodipicolinate synthase family protein [Isoptericola sp. BMS4]|uniref:dihydrodipicolinate synthase family protein n=1 Tax=Isoptericola sp. BMS4 TaxID=2527875 RepID=UPI00141EE91A|nr:dihydrodipicolinate synthase family protein [Isoptericola sp. BMS4]